MADDFICHVKRLMHVDVRRPRHKNAAFEAGINGNILMPKTDYLVDIKWILM